MSLRTIKVSNLNSPCLSFLSRKFFRISTLVYLVVMILFQGASLRDFFTIDITPLLKHSPLQPHLWVPATTRSSYRALCTLFLPLPPQVSSISAFERATHPVETGTFQSYLAFSGFVLSFAVSHFSWGCPVFLWELQNTAPFHPSSLATFRLRSLGR